MPPRLSPSGQCLRQQWDRCRRALLIRDGGNCGANVTCLPKFGDRYSGRHCVCWLRPCGWISYFGASLLCFDLLRFLRRCRVCVDELHRLASAALEFAAKPDLTQRYRELVACRRQKLFNRREWYHAVHERTCIDGIRVISMRFKAGTDVTMR